MNISKSSSFQNTARQTFNRCQRSLFNYCTVAESQAFLFASSCNCLQLGLGSCVVYTVKSRKLPSRFLISPVSCLHHLSAGGAALQSHRLLLCAYGDLIHLGPVTSVAALFYNPPGGGRAHYFPPPSFMNTRLPVEKSQKRQTQHRGKCWLEGRSLLRCLKHGFSRLCAGMRVQGGGLVRGEPGRGGGFWAGFFLLPREQTMVSWNNAADESLSKENKALTSWVLKAHSWANTLLL